MKKSFSIYTNGLKVTIKGDRMTAHREFGGITLWQGNKIVATFPKHSLKKFTIMYKDYTLIKAYTFDIKR